MQTIKLNVLVACEESQAVANAFRRLGHYAFSCDLQSCSGGHPEYHIIADVSPLLLSDCRFVTQSGVPYYVKKWDLIIAHPPCTYLTKASSTQMFPKPGIINPARYACMLDAVSFFNECLNAHSDYVAIENPVPLHIAHLPRPSQYVEPYWFGHPYTKRTCLWLKNLPPLMSTSILSHHQCYTSTCSGSRKRSKTFSGIADAMANQWSEFIINDSKYV